MGQDNEVVISFSNKTDSGLTIGGKRYDMDADAGSLMNHLLTISGGFGTLTLGARRRCKSDAFGIGEQDLIDEEPHLSSCFMGCNCNYCNKCW